MVENNSENDRREEDGSKDNNMNVKRRDLKRRYYVLFNE